jgi:hypothetical protein
LDELINNSDENSLYERGLKAFDNLDFVTKSNFAHAYKNFEDNFKSFFNKFRENDIVVTTDVNSLRFFF